MLLGYVECFLDSLLRDVERDLLPRTCSRNIVGSDERSRMGVKGSTH